MLQTFIDIVHVFVCLVLILVVLLQQGKGGGMGAAFGGSTAQVFGGRGAGNILTRATAVLATLFMLGSFGLGVMGKSRGGGLVVGGIGAPADAKPAVPALPANNAPALPTTPPATTTPAPTGGDKGGTPPATAPAPDAGKRTPPAAPGGKKGGGK